MMDLKWLTMSCGVIGEVTRRWCWHPSLCHPVINSPSHNDSLPPETLGLIDMVHGYRSISSI